MITWNNHVQEIKDGKKEMLFSELHSLLSSGLDFGRSFRLLIDGEGDKHLKRLLESLYASVVKGKTLWESFSASKRFSALDCGVLRIGEETGRIDESLHFLADYYHKRIEQRRMVTGAISYPLIILVTAMVVLVFMITVIVPMFEQVYARMGGELPGITRWIIGVSKSFPTYLLALLVIVAVIAVYFLLYGKTEGTRAFMAKVVLKIPIAGELIRKNYQARFCKLLYLLCSSEVPLLRGIGMLRDIITFYPYQRSFDTIGEGLKKGEFFADKLGEFPEIYDRKLYTLVRVGEETNRLEDMLLKQGEDLTQELEHKLKQLGNLMEPVLILGVGGLVAIVLISMYLPMFKLGGIIG
ncbi:MULTISPECIES: type II secretion system F family protein [Butyricimonas]|uniref:type II secretion system F family protein n=1 Tax=Butyricimonas TaxID=574697 RepID=UPI0007FB448B|nr:MULTISPECIES: type II secretion system F family protein [Butyricimonas]